MFCKSFKNISFFVVHLSQSISTLFCAPRPNTKNGRVPYPRPPAIHSAFLRQQHPQRKPLIFPVQRHSSAALFGGGGGAGITITPIAFIVVNNGEVSIKHISTEEGSIERTIGMIPDVVNGVTDVVNKFVDGKGKKTEENLEGLY